MTNNIFVKIHQTPVKLQVFYAVIHLYHSRNYGYLYYFGGKGGGVNVCCGFGRTGNVDVVGSWKLEGVFEGTGGNVIQFGNTVHIQGVIQRSIEGNNGCRHGISLYVIELNLGRAKR